MRYADMRAWTEESGALLDKKRLGRKQKARLATLLDQLDAAKQPPATPTRPVTGLDEHGQAAGDNNGGAHWRSRMQGYMSMREQRRASRFGRGGIQPMRSRIQRTRRKQRTGGVK
jgi:hypothetical protein